MRLFVMGITHGINRQIGKVCKSLDEALKRLHKLEGRVRDLRVVADGHVEVWPVDRTGPVPVPRVSFLRLCALRGHGDRLPQPPITVRAPARVKVLKRSLNREPARRQVSAQVLSINPSGRVRGRGLVR